MAMFSGSRGCQGGGEVRWKDTVWEAPLLRLGRGSSSSPSLQD